MRLLHVAEVSHGGVMSLVRDFAAAQVAAGDHVHTLLPPDAPSTPGRVHRWEPVRARPWTLVGARARLRSVVDEVRPDVVHLHSFFPGLLGRSLPLPTGTAIVYQPHSWAFQAVSRRPVRRVITRWEVRAARRTDAVITNCADEWAEARAAGVQARTTVVGLPVDTAHFHPVPEERGRDYRAELGLTAPYVVVCVGRLSTQKGQAALVAAWERRPLPDTDLVLVGPGDSSGLAALAPTTFGASIHHVGAQHDVRPWLWAADLCVQPSLYEGQSVAMAEALACGRPVVMTQVNGAREAIAPADDAPAGATVPVADLDALLDACATRLRDPGLREAEGRAARARALSLFDRDVVMARIEQTYRAAVGGSASSTPEGAHP